MIRRTTLALLSAIALAATPAAFAQSTAKKELVIGATAGSNVDVLKLSSGLKLTEAVVPEKTPDHYLLVAAVKSADKARPWARDVAEAFQTPEFKAVLDKHFAGYARPSFLQ